MKKAELVAFWLFVLLAAATRFHEVDRPFDAHTLNAWREADYTLVARSFHRESMNILEPRIAWRGDTSGRVEMEFPFLPWGAAALYQVVGERESMLRVISALAGALGVLVFALLARRKLPVVAAWIAVVLFGVNPLLLSLAGSMQPEPLTLLLVTVAVWMSWEWYEHEARWALLGAAGFTALAILSKSPAAYLGLLLGSLVLNRRGPRALLDPAVLLAALVATVPPVLWYVHAHGFYRETGLSLGLSNEAHFLNRTLVLHAGSWVMGNIGAELRTVFGWAGLLLALASLPEWRRFEIPWAWYTAVLIFYVVSANTSGDSWAFYYHSHSVAPACLLMGIGASTLLAGPAWKRNAALVTAAATLLLTSVVAFRIVEERFDGTKFVSMESCFREFGERVPPEARIIVRGGMSHDWTGRPVAYNESMAFAWMDRHGTNYPADAFSLEEVRALATGGPWYWLAQPLDLEDPEIARRARASFPLVAECEGFVLFEVPPRGELS